MGRCLHLGVGVDAKLVIDFDARVGFGVERTDEGNDIMEEEDIANAEVGAKEARVVSVSDDISGEINDDGCGYAECLRSSSLCGCGCRVRVVFGARQGETTLLQNLLFGPRL